MRLLVAENDARVRSALALFLKQQPNLIVAECANLDSLVAQIHQFKPDLVLLDWELPGRPAAALLFALNRSAAQPKIIVLSRRLDAETAALEAGAAAFISKTDPPEQLLNALRTVAPSHRTKVLG